MHVPFCTTKCHYCDFYSIAGHLDRVEDYLQALGREMRLQQEQIGRARVETIFIGGGTPTLLPVDALQRLLELVCAYVDLTPAGEFTIEANPNTFSADAAGVLIRGGVNRVSFGAQSFHRAELAMLQRDHDPESVPRAVAAARDAGLSNINLDLIFGIPGQTLASWDASLQQALALSPQHLSCYSLIYEPNTAMTARLRAGAVVPLDEQAELSLFEHTYRTLRSAGFVRYEVSNYARPGLECRHNLHYWSGAEYFAWGPSAAAHIGGYRWKNVQSLAHYLDALSATPPVLPLTQLEKLDPLRRAGELAMLQLRLARGIDLVDFQRRTGVDARQRLAQVLQKYAGLNVFVRDGSHLALTESAVAVSDAVLADVLAAF